MNPTTEQLLQTALALPENERWEFVEALLASENGPSDRPFDPAWMPEIQRRSAETDAGSVELTPWPVVRERVRQRLDSQSRG